MFGSNGFHVRCPEPLYSKVQDLSRRINRSISEIIRSALLDYLEKHQDEPVCSTYSKQEKP